MLPWPGHAARANPLSHEAVSRASEIQDHQVPRRAAVIVLQKLEILALESADQSLFPRCLNLT